MSANLLSPRTPIRQFQRSIPALIAGMVMIWTGCVDQATDPDAPIAAVLAMAAVFPEGASAQASFIDAWRVQVSRPGEGVIAERRGTVGPEQPTVSVEVPVTLETSCETLSVRVELSSGGEVWFRSEADHQICSGRGNEVLIQQLQWVRPQPTVSPGTLLFTIEEGKASSSTFRITYDGNDDLNWMTRVEEGNVDWVGLQPRTGSVTVGQPQDVTVMVNTVGLPPGRYTAHAVVVGEGFSEPIGRILVDLTVTQGPRIGLSPSSLFFATEEGASPPSQTFTITNVGGGTLNWNAADNVAWLNLSPTSGSLAPSQSQNVTVTVNSGSLSPGLYVAAITVADPNAADSPRIISANLNVSEGPMIGLSTTTLFFTTFEGTSPSGQLFTVSNSGGGALNWQASDDVGWLTVTPTSGTLGAGLGQWMAVLVNSGNLEPGNYLATITIQDPEAGNSPRAVSVNLTVISLAPTISNLLVTLLQLNDSTCGNFGSRFEFKFDYANPDGDILLSDGQFAGNPIALQWQFLPAGNPGSANVTAEVDGTGSAGTATFQMCIAYQVPGNTSVNIWFTLMDSGARQSNQLTTNIPRPVGATSPPRSSVSRSGGALTGLFAARGRGGVPPPLE